MMLETFLPWIGILAPSIIVIAGIIQLNTQVYSNKTHIETLVGKNIDLEKKLESIKSPDKTIVEEISGFIKSIEDQRQILKIEISKIQKEINHINSIIQKTKSQIYFFEMDVVQADRDFQEFSPKLEKLLNKQKDFIIANDFLDSLSQHISDINLYNKLENLQEKIKSNYYGQYSDLIKIGRCTIYEDKTRPEFYKATGDREQILFVEFGCEFENIPQVFVAIAGIDSCSSRNIRISAKVKDESITTKGFKLRVKTWHDSKIYGFSVVWMAFGSKIKFHNDI